MCAWDMKKVCEVTQLYSRYKTSHKNNCIITSFWSELACNKTSDDCTDRIAMQILNLIKLLTL